ncbi:alkaline phosphatase PafA [Urechidicola croceus]|uniref:Alkaline phosphatase n=1 Tax=Urechidicola croceus TaxID=1850246 RepID=A0A1D8P6Z1_9FLAO|nr:alkaline phosphatase PafA [Urechidicola croceus]AOW20307.1 alkaline phosphatase [Urechidicola croceus]
MKKTFLLILSIVLIVNCKSQNTNQSLINNTEITSVTKPKLVVGIVVDQMRYDYLTRFYDKYSEGGFKRLMNNGYNLKNTHYNYIPTFTAPGHASIYTGTTPENHGIIGNNWYDKFAKKSIYCVDDENYITIGSNSNEGKKSPKRLLTTTVTDQLHIAQNMSGKTIGIGIKDRSSVLPAGHTANGAYWFDGKNVGKWVSSSYYMTSLPKWVNEFNNTNKADTYLNQPWITLYNISTYTESIEDKNNYEGPLKGEKYATFPHDLPSLREKNGNYDLIKSTPFGNTLTTDFAISAIKGEKLGKSQFTDFLTISYSSTDYVGHRYGVESKEIEDTYIRLDKDLERLLLTLDKEIGNENYTLFLTADHAATQVPKYLTDLKIPSGYLNNQSLNEYLNNVTLDYFGSNGLIENISNSNIFLNTEKIRSLNLDKNKISETIVDELINFKDIHKTVSAKTLQTSNFKDGLLSLLQKGYNQKFSGDVLFTKSPSVISDYYEEKGGTTHGSGYSYDTHVPLLFYGNGIKKGNSNNYYPIVDIAPTISALLNIEFPNGSTGTVIVEVLK